MREDHSSQRRRASTRFPKKTGAFRPWLKKDRPFTRSHAQRYARFPPPATIVYLNRRMNRATNLAPILPGQTIGMLGGGQLGRMFAIAARRMGYRVHAMDPTPDCPTGQVADLELNAPYDDLDAARQFALGVDVVTFEFENVPAQTLSTITDLRPVHPSPHVLDTCRHRLHEKSFLSSNGFPCAPYRPVHDPHKLASAVRELGGEMGLPTILKSADYGYDGKGQVTIDATTDLQSAWKSMGRPVGVVEAFVDFEKEISVIVARTAGGQISCFVPFENQHRRHILDITTCPADIDPSVATRAMALATGIANKLAVVGVIAVEMFLRAGGELIVNELAPRPHNSGHLTFDACITSQFEQQLRAICNLPLGDPTLIRPAAMANLLGDIWSEGEPDWAAALSHPGVKLHLYGKSRPESGRKMGHLTAMADSPAAARSLVLAARDALARRSP
jgi:5-(carboxyamino)imidazole ribonucleotide synthase